MPRSLAHALLVALGGSTLICVLLAAFAIYPRSVLYHDRARAQWQQQGLRHYELEASWASNWSFGNVRAEVLDNRVVRGIDLDTGQELSPARRVVVSYYVAVDYLFPMIQEQMRPASSWRFQIARYHPQFADWLDPCAAILPQISYDPTYAYPTSINYRGTPCFNGGNVYLKIKYFRPLP